MKLPRLPNLPNAVRLARSGLLFSAGTTCSVLAKAFEELAKRSLKAALLGHGRDVRGTGHD
jgi:hypothetical protein